MSACTYIESVGNESAIAVPASTDVAELTTTLTPRSASRRAAASPMPLDEPVTIATVSSNRSIVVLLCVGVRVPEPMRPTVDTSRSEDRSEETFRRKLGARSERLQLLPH